MIVIFDQNGRFGITAGGITGQCIVTLQKARKIFRQLKFQVFYNSCEINVYSIFMIIIKISCTCFNRRMHFIACRSDFWNSFT